MNVDQYIADVVHKKPHASKKWLMAVIGISCVMFTFIITALICLLRPDVVQQLNVLSGQVITFLGALVGAYTTGQSFVDWKVQSNISSISSSSVEHKDIEVTERQVDLLSRAKESDYATE